ncbi:hypothetical protein P7C70_g6716, partial [Phenoliferia sp. Uapishka_3]
MWESSANEPPGDVARDLARRDRPNVYGTTVQCSSSPVHSSTPPASDSGDATSGPTTSQLYQAFGYYLDPHGYYNANLSSQPVASQDCDASPASPSPPPANVTPSFAAQATFAPAELEEPSQVLERPELAPQAGVGETQPSRRDQETETAFERPSLPAAPTRGSSPVTRPTHHPVSSPDFLHPPRSSSLIIPDSEEPESPPPEQTPASPAAALAVTGGVKRRRALSPLEITSRRRMAYDKHGKEWPVLEVDL